jgi:hypothetical protein
LVPSPILCNPPCYLQCRYYCPLRCHPH